ncbi:DinB family protein [uncultured Paludibaculum sp.]|uniref:DinB family protein n=1 Tax=uncultured Paludibaculum sp. TaxID=1765020 RepID=UPI002AAB6C7B|nr:DinB family protein [uncultured Paludibaculum sp.]
MQSRIPGFHGEYLWELDIARMQLLALANAAPEQIYGWSPTEGTRSFSAVLVHIAVGNFGLLHFAGIPTSGGIDLYGNLQGDEFARTAAIVRENMARERTITEKQSVIDLLSRSFEAVQQSFGECSFDALEAAVDCFGERTTLRRVFLRMLTHTHEHMGQAIAYARTYGMAMPWPDPLKAFDSVPPAAELRKSSQAQ